jgi:sugar lactone lactonase YvrE
LVFGARDERSRRDLIDRPFGIAVWQGRIYVCDVGAGDVKVFDLEQGSYRRLGEEVQIIAAPTSIHVDRDGYAFVVEAMRQLIHIFSPDETYLTSFHIRDGRPAGLVTIGSELFVPDLTGDRILVLDRSTGKLLRTLGQKGHGPGEFLMPNAIATDSDGNLYVSDQMNFRFQKLNRKGKPLLQTGEAGDRYGTFARPRGIAVGPDGVIYVVESIFEVVQMFNQEGQVLMGFGNFHAAPGFLELPAGIVVDKSALPYFSEYLDPQFEPEYLLFVTSQLGKAKIGVYAFGKLKAGAERPVVPALGEPP